MCCWRKGFSGVREIFELDCDSQAAVWMIEVNLSTAFSISLYVFNLKFRFISFSTRFWNLIRSVSGEKSLGDVILTVGEALTVNRTDEWSEFRSKIFSGVQFKLLGTLLTNMSGISGFLRIKDGQYMGPGGANTLYFLALVKLWSTLPLGLVARHPQLWCFAFMSPPSMKLELIVEK
jgi:hypothetical protein